MAFRSQNARSTMRSYRDSQRLQQHELHSHRDSSKQGSQIHKMMEPLQFRPGRNNGLTFRTLGSSRKSLRSPPQTTVPHSFRKNVNTCLTPSLESSSDEDHSEFEGSQVPVNSTPFRRHRPHLYKGFQKTQLSDKNDENSQSMPVKRETKNMVHHYKLTHPTPEMPTEDNNLHYKLLTKSQRSKKTLHDVRRR